MSGILSNTDETTPRPSAVCHDAAGNVSTGITEAAVTSARRKIVPLKVSGRMVQSGARKTAVSKIAAQTASPSTGTVSSSAGNFRFAVTFATSAAVRMTATMKTRTPSTRKPLGGFFTIGEKRCCRIAAGTAKIASATTAAIYASRTLSGLIPSIHIIVVVVSPTTLPAPPALEAATIAAR